MKRFLVFLLLLVSLLLPATVKAAPDLVMPNSGEEAALTLFLASNTILQLYCADKTPAETDTVASYTLCTGNGYASKTLTGGSWAITPGAPTVAVYAQQTYTFSGALGTVYGYVVTNAAGTTLYWAEKFSSSVTIATDQDQIKVTPRITAD